jgi:Phosphotransferase enzyme family
MIDGLDDVLEGSSEPGLPELRATLRELIVGLGSAARVVEQRRLKVRVYRLRVEANGGVRALVLKRLEPGQAQRNQLAAERWLPALGMGEAGPPLLGVAAARDGGCVWHVYDDLGDDTLKAHAADRQAVEAAVEVIARLHAGSAGYPLLAECRLYGGDLGMPFYAASVRDAIHSLESLQQSAVALSPERAALRDRLLVRLHQRLEEQPCRVHAMGKLSGPEVLLHGDLWATNILVCAGEEGPRARLIDWDKAGVGPISYDLSTLLRQFPPADRGWILDVYRGSLERLGWRLPSVADLNRLCTTAEWARWANCVIWPALAAADHHAEWAFDALAEVEQWCELMTPVLPQAE